MSLDDLLQPEPTQPTSETVDITDHAVQMLEEMSDERMELLVNRTLRRLGVDRPEEADGDLFAEAFSAELKVMVVNDSMKRLQEAGLVQPTGVNGSGEIMYELTPEGQDLAEQRKL